MSVTAALIFEKIGAQAGEVMLHTRISPSRTSAIWSTVFTTRAGPSTMPGEAGAPISSVAFGSWERAHSCTRCVVTPQSMIVIGSVTTSGATPTAGGGVQSASLASSSFRFAAIGGQ